MSAPTLEAVLALVTRGTAALGVFLLTFWKADDQLSDQGRKYLYQALVGMTASPEAALTVMDRYFYRAMPVSLLLRNTAIFTIASMAIFIAIYVSSVPGFFDSLINDPFQRGAVLRHLALNGFPVVFLSNYAAFSLLIAVYGRKGQPVPPMRALAIDIAMRIAVFFGVTAAVYLAFAQFAGSFGGSPQAAIKAVGPTIALAARFGDLTGAYLYAAALSAFPLFVAAVISAMQGSPAISKFIRGIFFFLPFENKPIRSIAAVLGVFFGTAALAISAIASLF